MICSCVKPSTLVGRKVKTLWSVRLIGGLSNILLGLGSAFAGRVNALRTLDRILCAKVKGFGAENRSCGTSSLVCVSR